MLVEQERGPKNCCFIHNCQKFTPYPNWCYENKINSLYLSKLSELFKVYWQETKKIKLCQKYQENYRIAFREYFADPMVRTKLGHWKLSFSLNQTLDQSWPLSELTLSCLLETSDTGSFIMEPHWLQISGHLFGTIKVDIQSWKICMDCIPFLWSLSTQKIPKYLYKKMPNKL